MDLTRKDIQEITRDQIQERLISLVQKKTQISTIPPVDRIFEKAVKNMNKEEALIFYNIIFNLIYYN